MIKFLIPLLFLISCSGEEQTLCTRDGYGMEIATVVTYKPLPWEECP